MHFGLCSLACSTFDAQISAYYSNGTAIFTGVDNSYSYGRSFTANQSGTVYIKVYPLSSGNTGSYAITYSTGSTRPGSSSTYNDAPAAPTGLSASAASSSSIYLTWDSVSEATRYYVYQSSSASGTYYQLDGYVTSS